MEEQNLPLSASEPGKIKTEKKKRSWLKKFTWKFFTILFLLLAAFAYWKYFFTYSKGNRTGLLQKFSYKGTIFKTLQRRADVMDGGGA